PDPSGVVVSGHGAVHMQSRRRYPSVTHHRHPSGLPSEKILDRKPWVGCEFLCTEVVTPPHAVRTICTYNMRTSPGRSTRAPANGHSCTTNKNPWCPSTAGCTRSPVGPCCSPSFWDRSWAPSPLPHSTSAASPPRCSRTAPCPSSHC